MDLGLFVFLGFFAYSSLIIKSTSNSLFVVLPIMALGVIAAIILGTYPIVNEEITLTTTSEIYLNSTETVYNINGTELQSSIRIDNGTNTNPVLNISTEWGVTFFSMFHYLLAFVNVVNALYFIGDKIKVNSKFK